jgi:hypothetical protein
MWELAASLILGIGKLIFERIAKKKLNDKEFMEHIRAHQIRRKNVGKTALDFEDALAQAQKELDQEGGDGA